jgi:transposase
MKLFVGLDVSSEKLDACFMTDDSICSVLKEASYGNSQLGASQIKEYILEFSQKFEIESLVIGMEATSLYSFHPAMFFKEDLELNQLNLMVSVEQPNKIKHKRALVLTARKFTRLVDTLLRKHYVTINSTRHQGA